MPSRPSSSSSASAAAAAAIWPLLSEREAARTTYARVSAALSGAAAARSARAPAPEELFYSIAESHAHRAANRYSNIFAYDRTAVRVGAGEGEYLNANVVCDGFGGWWVASQAPLPSTIPLFLSALATSAASRHPLVRPLIRSASDSGSPRGAIIVQLTGYQEGGMRKADPYVNHLQDAHATPLPALGATLVEGTLPYPSSGSGSGSPASVTAPMPVPVAHYHFEAWPDHGVPSPKHHSALCALVREVGRRKEAEGKEVWVHCSAGVGRSGAFIALSSLLLRDPTRSAAGATHAVPSPLGPLRVRASSDDLDPDGVARTVDALREYRGMMVQTEQQLGLVYEVVRAEREQERAGMGR